ncbi:hypothetical protein INR49_017290 [Caranx melampygus]|nr:hypothetical protein INR49_017290 [Caranx melampygus]
MTMSFFGKLKNLHSGPPAPPKRTDNNAGFAWPQDEFDDEEGDMYEAPPCERPAVKVPPRQVEENVYLAPEIDRTEKPGRNKMMPPPPVRSPPASVPAPNTEEDVYLDPNEEQEDNDDNDNDDLLCPSPTWADAANEADASISHTHSKEWFAGDCNRKTAEDLLERVNKDGAFLIRHSSTQTSRQPYTLVVFYQQKVYNIPIRFLEETQGYALGKEGKKNEEIFTSLDEIISHHRNNQLLLIDSKSHAKHTTYLTKAARP